MKITDNQNKSETFIHTKFEEMEFANQVRLLLSDQDNCQETLVCLNVGDNNTNRYGDQPVGLTTLTCVAGYLAISCGNDNAQYTCRCMRIVF
jgi:hypothetical protein